MNYTKLKLLLVCASGPFISLLYNSIESKGILLMTCDMLTALGFAYLLYKGDGFLRFLYIFCLSIHCLNTFLGKFSNFNIISKLILVSYFTYCIYLLSFPNEVLKLLKEKGKKR